MNLLNHFNSFCKTALQKEVAVSTPTGGTREALASVRHYQHCRHCAKSMGKKEKKESILFLF